MKLIDSNIIIYSALQKYSFLREIFKEDNVFVSEISFLEVLGFGSITAAQENYFNAIFLMFSPISVSSEIILEAIKLRKKYKLSVGDSIIAASAMGLNLELLTNNIADFKKIDLLKITNPN
jgi:predicted nucleic acid-binding protein